MAEILVLLPKNVTPHTTPRAPECHQGRGRRRRCYHSAYSSLPRERFSVTTYRYHTESQPANMVMSRRLRVQSHTPANISPRRREYAFAVRRSYRRPRRHQRIAASPSPAILPGDRQEKRFIGNISYDVEIPSFCQTPIRPLPIT